MALSEKAGPPIDQPEPEDDATDPATPKEVLSGFDVNSLTLGEVGMIESLSGAGIGAIADDAHPKGLLLQAVIYVVKRRTEPRYTFPMAAMVTLGEAVKIISDPDGEDPSA